MIWHPHPTKSRETRRTGSKPAANCRAAGTGSESRPDLKCRRRSARSFIQATRMSNAESIQNGSISTKQHELHQDLGGQSMQSRTVNGPRLVRSPKLRQARFEDYRAIVQLASRYARVNQKSARTWAFVFRGPSVADDRRGVTAKGQENLFTIQIRI